MTTSWASGLHDHAGLPTGSQTLPYGAAALINALGTGVFLPFAVLFFQRRLGLAFGRVGLGLSLAAMIALLGVLAAGQLIDRAGAKHVLVAALLTRAVAYLAYLHVTTFAAFVCVAALDALCLRVSQLAEQAVVGDLARHSDPDRWFALSRTALNAGLGGGALLGSLLISLDEGSYTWLVFGNAVSFVLAGTLYARLRSTAQAGRRQRVVSAVWRDRDFLRLCLANAVLWLCAMAVEIALPVYLKAYLHAPTWTVSLVFALNTLLVLLLQIPVTRGTGGMPRVRVMICGAACYGGSFLLLLATTEISRAALVVILVSAVTMFTAGEMLVAVAGTALITSLARGSGRGPYLAASHLMLGTAGAAAPVLLTGTLEVSPALMWALMVLLVSAAATLIAPLHLRLAARPQL